MVLRRINKIWTSDFRLNRSRLSAEMKIVLLSAGDSNHLTDYTQSSALGVAFQLAKM